MGKKSKWKKRCSRIVVICTISGSDMADYSGKSGNFTLAKLAELGVYVHVCASVSNVCVSV